MADVCQTTFKLNNGASIPAVGLGTWQGQPGSEDALQMRNTIIHALKSGYRLIDTAQVYGVEDIVGEAIRASGVPREEITVVTKLFGASLHDPAAALARSIAALKLDYIDLFLMHWPQAFTEDGSRPLRPEESPTFVEVWQDMEKLVGPQCRAIGVSNFTQRTLEILLREATISPAVNQVELHAFNPALKLVPWCHERGVRVMSWSTLGSRKAPEILAHSLFTDLAQKHGVSPAVISLSWVVQRGVVVIPMSSNQARIEENIKLITLPAEDMEIMDNAHKTIRKCRFSDEVPGLMFDIPGKGKGLLGWTRAEFGFEDEEGNWIN
ncbi:uncharacterized protein TRUGW13939_05765 [Talaromyces rugulosus]|uniref:D-xylose reductase [NAD(P)H] n=1 Tax=Talaromyces rugulosus TaxID=121627 RepID=A0A7H8QX23_TALRU|nr:uncharacterized protein TRUGW13939_05765 [Talaromyces rugulosus]QKX58640.1 hypothetical protein TRUGW13939_05765 [Talaromyces rugulosus]